MKPTRMCVSDGHWNVGYEQEPTGEFTFENSPKVLDPKVSKKHKEITDSIALHPDFSTELAKVAEVSVEKGYIPFNWLDKDSGVTVSYCLKAHDRHLKQAKKGIDINREYKLDGTEINHQVHHFVYAAYNLLMAAQIIKDKPSGDDRLFRNGKLKLFKESK